MIRNLIAIITLLSLTAIPAFGAEDDSATGIIMFDLGKHVKELAGESCSICHPADAPSITPPTEVCLECHEQGMLDRVRFPVMKTHGPQWSLNHGPMAKMGMYQCSTCHEQSVCLDCHKAGFPDEQGEIGNNFVNIHRSDFQVTHPIIAKTDPQLCSTCHEARYCSDCHNAFLDAPDMSFSSHKKSWQSLVGSHNHENLTDCTGCHTDSVLPSHTWSNSHAREARRDMAVCQTCHPQGDVCLTCHSAKTGLGINPHPSDWSNSSGGTRGTCLKCHITIP